MAGYCKDDPKWKSSRAAGGETLVSPPSTPVLDEIALAENIVICPPGQLRFAILEYAARCDHVHSDSASLLAACKFNELSALLLRMRELAQRAPCGLLGRYIDMICKFSDPYYQWFDWDDKDLGTIHTISSP